MSEPDEARAHWERAGLLRSVLTALTAAGIDIDRLTVEDLAVTDQFHNGGRPSTLQLAALAGLDESSRNRPPLRVLDVGGGLGGPARTLAAEFGCDVTSVDLTPSYVEVALALTDRVGLADRVRHQVGNALALPFGPGSFDIVWTQNSGMNIADKEALYAEFRRVLRDGGTLAFQEPMAGQLAPPHFPTMWADDESLSFLRRPEEMLALLNELRFETRAWQPIDPAPLPATFPVHAVPMIVMGPERLNEITAASARNVAEGRLVTMLGVFTRR